MCFELSHFTYTSMMITYGKFLKLDSLVKEYVHAEGLGGTLGKSVSQRWSRTRGDSGSFQMQCVPSGK